MKSRDQAQGDDRYLVGSGKMRNAEEPCIFPLDKEETRLMLRLSRGTQDQDP